MKINQSSHPIKGIIIIFHKTHSIKKKKKKLVNTLKWKEKL